MPALPDVPNVLKVVFEGVQSGHPMANVFYFSYTGTAPTNATCVLIAQDFIAALATGDTVHQLHSLMDADTSYENTVVTDLTSSTSGSGNYLDTVAGTRSGTILPASAAMLETDHISRRYRGGHPRKYWPFGVGADLTDPRTWSSSIHADALAWRAGFTTGYQAISRAGCAISKHVNVSYLTGGARRTVPVVDDIVSAALSQALCSQRRRLGKR